MVIRFSIGTGDGNCISFFPLGGWQYKPTFVQQYLDTHKSKQHKTNP